MRDPGNGYLIRAARLAVCVAFAASAFDARAATIHIRVTAAPGAETCLPHATLLSTSFGDANVQRTAVPAGGGVVTLAIADTTSVTLLATATDCWSETVEAIAPFNVDYSVALRRATHLRATIEPSRGARPRAIAGVVFPSPEPSANALTATDAGHPIDCTLEKLQWDCVAPADVPFDLRLNSAGCASIYYWNVIAPNTRAVTLEPRPMPAGASVSGWVEGPDQKPTETHVVTNEPTELQLHLERAHEFSAMIVTPAGTPASGALTRSSRDGGASWSDTYTDVDGRFEYDASAARSLLLAVITPSYPVLFAELQPQERATPTLMLHTRGGLLRVKEPAFVSRGGTRVPISMFFTPGIPGGMYHGAAYLEPGVYSVCSRQIGEAECRQVSIEPDSEQTVDPRAKTEHAR